MALFCLSFHFIQYKMHCYIYLYSAKINAFLTWKVCSSVREINCIPLSSYYVILIIGFVTDTRVRNALNFLQYSYRIFNSRRNGAAILMKQKCCTFVILLYYIRMYMCIWSSSFSLLWTFLARIKRISRADESYSVLRSLRMFLTNSVHQILFIFLIHCL